MLTNQSLYDKACTSLRTYGNQYGAQCDRKWGWINPNNSNDRCAIARFIPGNTQIEVIANLSKELGCKQTEEVYENVVVKSIIQLFDYMPYECNDSAILEDSLKQIAEHYNLTYSAKTEVKTETKELVLEI